MPYKSASLLVLLTLLCLVALAAALAYGSVPITPGEIFAALGGTKTEPQRSIILELRLPRALAGFCVGGLLALSGALLQSLLRNPLADPYVLGTSGGAAVGALLAMLTGLSGTAEWRRFHRRAARDHPGVRYRPPRRRLVARAPAAHRHHPRGGWGALIAFILTIAPEHNLRGMLFWMMGDLVAGGSTLDAALLVAAVLIVSLAAGASLEPPPAR